MSPADEPVVAVAVPALVVRHRDPLGQLELAWRSSRRGSATRSSCGSSSPRTPRPSACAGRGGSGPGCRSCPGRGAAPRAGAGAPSPRRGPGCGRAEPPRARPARRGARSGRRATRRCGRGGRASRAATASTSAVRSRTRRSSSRFSCSSSRYSIRVSRRFRVRRMTSIESIGFVRKSRAPRLEGAPAAVVGDVRREHEDRQVARGVHLRAAAPPSRPSRRGPACGGR